MLLHAISKNDYWYTINTEVNTSEIYHFHDNIIDKIGAPLANEVSAIWFANKDLGFIAGWHEIAYYSNGKITMLPPPPSAYPIKKIFGNNDNRFWALDNHQALFLFENKVYRRIYENLKINDFIFFDDQHGLILCQNSIYKIVGTSIDLLVSSEKISGAWTIKALDNNNIWLAGSSGMIAFIHHREVQTFRSGVNSDLNEIAIVGNNEIWISGNDGILLYSGQHAFSREDKTQPGFDPHQLFQYGRDATDEYGVGIADLNSDGYDDIYSVCIFGRNRLYMNYTKESKNLLTPISFVEESMKRGTMGISSKITYSDPTDLFLGAAIGDINNDGSKDIYLCCLNGKNRMLLNNGKGFFRDVSDQKDRVCEDLHRSNMAVLADVDNDGDLDLYVCNEEGSNKLYLNNGTGHFTDITLEAGLTTQGGGMCASFADINNDGRPDLCVSFWFHQNRIYLNESSGNAVKFRDITANTDLAKTSPARSNAVVFGDINNDGSPDLFIANRNASNKLYLNDGQGIFRDVSDQWLGNKVYLSNGAVFADFDQDGFKDLYVTNVGNNILYKNIKGARFEDFTSEYGADVSGYCTGCSTGDIDNDGDIDLYVANYINGSSQLLVNNIEHKNMVTLILKGITSNRDAIGAKAFLYGREGSEKPLKLEGYCEVNGGSGYGSVSSNKVFFALSRNKEYSVVIKFPASGKEVTLRRIHPGDVIRVNEEDGFLAWKSLAANSIIRFFKDREDQLGIIKMMMYFISFGIFMIIWHRQKKIFRTRVIFSLATFLIFIVVNQMVKYEAIIPSFGIPLGISIVCLLMVHLITEKKMIKQQAAIEKQKVREKISRDLHDDLASTLGSISIYSNSLIKRNKSEQTDSEKISYKIAELSQTALQSVSDIIWVNSPKHDSLSSLLSKARNLYYNLLEDNGINFVSEIDLPEEDAKLPDELRNNLYLILKEAAQNIISHSGAKNVTLCSRISENKCVIKVSDNGKGFEKSYQPDNPSHGNGLANMKRRAEESGIGISIDSRMEHGTSINLSFPI